MMLAETKLITKQFSDAIMRIISNRTDLSCFKYGGYHPNFASSPCFNCLHKINVSFRIRIYVYDLMSCKISRVQFKFLIIFRKVRKEFAWPPCCSFTFYRDISLTRVCIFLISVVTQNFRTFVVSLTPQKFALLPC